MRTFCELCVGNNNIQISKSSHLQRKQNIKFKLFVCKVCDWFMFSSSLESVCVTNSSRWHRNKCKPTNENINLNRFNYFQSE